MLHCAKVMLEAEMHPSPTASMTRRRLIGAALAFGSLASIGGARRALSQASGLFLLPPLPYPEDALAPVISSTTIGFHYGKHHRAYVDNLNKAVEGTDLANNSLEDIVKATAGDPARVGVSTTPRRIGTTSSTGTACGRTAAGRRPA